jgi:hypothetical protein
MYISEILLHPPGQSAAMSHGMARIRLGRLGRVLVSILAGLTVPFPWLSAPTTLGSAFDLRQFALGSSFLYYRVFSILAFSAAY